METEEWDVSVQTCLKAEGFPKTVLDGLDGVETDHTVKTFIGGRLRWMSNVTSLRGLKRGDVVVFWGDPRFLNAPLLMLWAKLKGVKSIWWGQGYTAYSAKRVWLRQSLMRMADGVILYTDRETQRYRDGGYRHPHLYAKNNSLDQEPIKKAIANLDPERLEELKAKYGLPAGKTLIFVGRLTEKAQLDIAFRALALPNLSEHHLVIIGDGDLRRGLEELAAELKIANRVHWIGATYKEDDIAPFMATADALIYPGAIGLSIFHAFGYGLPVITHENELNQMPEFAALENGVNGITFPEGSSQGFAEAVEKLGTRARSDWYRDAQGTVDREWNMDNTVRKFKKAILDVAASK
jgi:glycosyltransferase involved in cell wall biosynthesis